MIRVVLLGDFGVGKTSLFRQFLDRKFQEVPSNTMVEDERMTCLKVGDQDVDLLITDTAGREKRKGGFFFFFFSFFVCLFLSILPPPLYCFGSYYWVCSVVFLTFFFFFPEKFVFKVKSNFAALLLRTLEKRTVLLLYSLSQTRRVLSTSVTG